MIISVVDKWCTMQGKELGGGDRSLGGDGGGNGRGGREMGPHRRRRLVPDDAAVSNSENATDIPTLFTIISWAKHWDISIA